uniref:Uncharacterized protein AlNc14C134G7040 n=1 Tax=Albugo laibachii Nc14 TaxID=890382 RepID=F0WKI8_9STRA|nr:conserved hypothetical protein [Albugo laibachii Nc14]|eukprot:CCA21794.1 conserved hypothetical protein [Albugo laibachii Nc14]
MSQTSGVTNTNAQSLTSGIELTNIGVGCTGPSYAAVAANASKSPNEPVFRYEITNALADFLTLHFTAFNLPPEDYIVIRNSRNASDDRKIIYSGRNTSGSFYSQALYTTSLILELFAPSRAVFSVPGASRCVGFQISDYHFLAQSAALELSSHEEVCGADDSREAACFKAYPNIAESSNSVIRLLIHKSTGSFFCTGWLVGCQGHVITNNHCIGTQEDASNSQFEVKAQGNECAVNCATPYGCPGTIVATSATLIRTSSELDYTLVLLPTNPSSTFGYLKLRATGAVLNERIYIPQNPAGWGTRVSMKTDNGYGSVESLSTGGCAVDQVAYSLDTQGGSSGSPVIAWSDNAVVALHHCGGCPNTAINIYKIVNDLQAQGLLPSCSLSPSTSPISTPSPAIPIPTMSPPPQSSQTEIVTKTIDGTLFATARTTSVDYIDFTIGSDITVTIDVLSMETPEKNVFVDVNGDCNAGYIDSSLILFRVNGGTIDASGVVASNDDAPDGFGKDDGSISSRDSFLSMSLSAGTYRLAVGTSPLDINAAIAKQTALSATPRICGESISNYGSYRVKIQVVGMSTSFSVQSPGTHIGNQCQLTSTLQPYSLCPYHKEKGVSYKAEISGTIIRRPEVSVSVDSIPFTTTAFGRLNIEIVSYASADGYNFINVNGFCTASYIDPVVYLFKKEATGLTMANVVTASDDDENFARNQKSRTSISFRDPYVSLALPKGTYVLVVGRYPLSLSDATRQLSTSSVNMLTPSSCGVATNSGNYRATIKSSTTITMTAPDSYRGKLCSSQTGRKICSS